jgi:hypothetical protein
VIIYYRAQARETNSGKGTVRMPDKPKQSPDVKRLADLVRAFDRAPTRRKKAIRKKLATLTGDEKHPVKTARRIARPLLRDYTAVGGPRLASPGRFTADRVRGIVPTGVETNRSRH